MRKRRLATPRAVRLLFDRKLSGRLAEEFRGERPRHRCRARVGPPTIVWLRVGNASTDAIASMLHMGITLVVEFAGGCGNGMSVLAHLAAQLTGGGPCELRHSKLSVVYRREPSLTATY